MDADTVEAIATLAVEAAGITHNLNGLEYSPVPLHLPPHPTEPAVKAIRVHTLRGIVEYLELETPDGSHPDGLAPGNAFVHVVSPDRVDVMGALLPGSNHRHTFAAAVPAYPLDFPWGRYVDPESLIITLQHRFAPSPDRDALAALLGGVTAASEVQKSDDGVTQRVTTRTGASLMGEKTIKNPWNLTPYRTFPEVHEAAAGDFILRMDKASNVALFPANEGVFSNRAVDAIGGFLTDHIPQGFRVVC